MNHSLIRPVCQGSLGEQLYMYVFYACVQEKVLI